MKYKIVKLKNVVGEYERLGLGVESLGVILGEKQGKALVMFFSNVNQGDYLTVDVSKADLTVTDMALPEKLCSELEEYINDNQERIAEKVRFEENPFGECELVELIVEKSQYAKLGLHKGERGVIASSKATRNKILVDFGREMENCDGFVSVDFNDIKKV